MRRDTSAPPELAALAADLVEMGLALGTDFYVAGMPTPGFVSSEHVGIGFGLFHPGSYDIWYHDMGRSDGLLVTQDFEQAREFFVQEALRIAAGHCRGPHYSGDFAPETPWNELLGMFWKERHGTALPTPPQ